MDRRVHVSLGISCGAESDACWAKVIRQGLVTPSQTHSCSCHMKWPHVSTESVKMALGQIHVSAVLGFGRKRGSRRESSSRHGDRPESKRRFGKCGKCEKSP